MHFGYRSSGVISMKPIIAAVVILAFLLLSPLYAIYWKTNFAKAELSKQELLAKAEVARAEGVAASNKIIGDSLAGKENYLKYLWIQSLNNDHTKLIYVPTEANIPILEAGRAVSQ